MKWKGRAKNEVVLCRWICGLKMPGNKDLEVFASSGTFCLLLSLPEILLDFGRETDFQIVSFWFSFIRSSSMHILRWGWFMNRTVQITIRNWIMARSKVWFTKVLQNFFQRQKTVHWNVMLTVRSPSNDCEEILLASTFSKEVISEPKKLPNAISFCRDAW